MKNKRILITAAVTIKRRNRHNMNNINNRWIGLMAALAFVGMMTSARGGSLDAPAGPMDPASAMYTLEDIYKVLDTHTTNVTKRTSFKEPTAGPTTGTMHNLNDIMTLAKRAPVEKTGQTNTYAVGDDGTDRIGVAWPTQRFTAVASTGAETNQIRDNLTGLIWARNANMFPCATNWGAAVTNCNNLDYGGTNDWRLPNVRELFSLIDFSQANPCTWLINQGFIDVKSGVWMCTSTTSAANTSNAWVLRMDTGGTPNNYTKTDPYYVWPVRGGQ